MGTEYGKGKLDGVMLEYSYIGRSEVAGWGHETDNWNVTLTYEQRRYITVFHKGLGHKRRAPGLVEVVESLLLDTTSYDDAADFDGWCDELGFDSDSRWALAAYLEVQKQAKGVHRLFGTDFERFAEIEF